MSARCQSISAEQYEGLQVEILGKGIIIPIVKITTLSCGNCDIVILEYKVAVLGRGGNVFGLFLI